MTWIFCLPSESMASSAPHPCTQGRMAYSRSPSASTLVPAPTRRGLRRSVRTATHSGYRSRVRASMAGVRMRPLRETSPLLLLGVR